VGADRIVEALADCTERFNLALTALERGRSTQPTGEEIEAGATALRSGMDTATLSGFARSAPGNRSLALPLLMVASLTDHNVPQTLKVCDRALIINDGQKIKEDLVRWAATVKAAGIKE